MDNENNTTDNTLNNATVSQNINEYNLQKNFTKALINLENTGKDFKFEYEIKNKMSDSGNLKYTYDFLKQGNNYTYTFLVNGGLSEIAYYNSNENIIHYKRNYDQWKARQNGIKHHDNDLYNGEMGIIHLSEIDIKNLELVQNNDLLVYSNNNGVRLKLNEEGSFRKIEIKDYILSEEPERHTVSLNISLTPSVSENIEFPGWTENTNWYEN